jgi:hypothetical protein
MMQTRRFVSWLWLLSGLPVGIALVLVPPQARLACFAALIAVETGHAFSPIVLAWTTGGFRRIMYEAPLKYLGLPAAAFAFAAAAPLVVVMWVYWAWNIYHFGMQNFGVLSLCRGGIKRRWLAVGSCLGLTTAGMVAATHYREIWFLLYAMTSVNHWVVDIGLSSRASGRQWTFIGAVLFLGTIGFLWEVPTSNQDLTRMIPMFLSARAGLGFVHFLYSRWVWKLSDPQARATIGRDLLVL